MLVTNSSGKEISSGLRFFASLIRSSAAGFSVAGFFAGVAWLAGVA